MITFNLPLRFKAYLKELFTGLTVPQQYICVSLEDFQNPLSVYLSSDGDDTGMDVTGTHLFLGYKPLIIAIVYPHDRISLAAKTETTLRFVHDASEENSVSSDPGRAEKLVATIKLRTLATKRIENNKIVFYQGDYGRHRFINPIYQFVNNQREKFRRKTPNNVSLPGNLYDQVRIAYSVPRIISLVTVSEGNKMNLFPTDLHGPCGKDFYLGSLRHGGIANSQVEKTGKVVLSFMPAEEYRTVYGTGKNHMQAMREFDNFSILEERSKLFKMPLPAFVLHYKELERIDSFDVGIHRIHSYRVLHSEKVREGYTLAHIHQYYAQWRIDRLLPLNMRLR